MVVLTVDGRTATRRPYPSRSSLNCPSIWPYCILVVIVLYPYEVRCSSLAGRCEY
ncbi:hypothetical protein FIBSPDRAFT_880574 [Athelia psychrophila]|uniref:Uncharacterized protein n=1 Tax=Athelia psychrophila TaxID=1759441 RepID=A0A167SN59_9AGAM|nr:hypothetical protein FIBSPDRAFT_880574 [Fibularhizoctonia sp. CBS 109695]